MFPVYAGMNRSQSSLRLVVEGVPRVRGDEPVHMLNRDCRDLCSPCTRG